MKKQKENIFAEKFKLLSSQASDEINWTSSDSSEFENGSSNIDVLCTLTINKPKKRKRKQKVPKNISNLDITYLDARKDNKLVSHGNKDAHSFVEKKKTSPILGKTAVFPPYNYKVEPTSPILSSSASIKSEKPVKSPILILKAMSPKLSPKVRKKLFDVCSTTCENHVNKLNNRNKSANDCLDKRKFSLNDSEYLKNQSKSQTKVQYSETNDNQNMFTCIQSEKSINIENQSLITKIVKSTENLRDSKEQKNICTIQETPETEYLDDSIAMLKTNSLELANKVKKYFDSHFSLDNASQLTISETTTPKNSSKTSDDIEITNTITQVAPNTNTTESNETVDKITTKDKKLRYKKDGLAYRLNNLLKKQIASVSLWHHERFMAANSNFVIPKGEYVLFRICRTHFKYGVYLLEVTDMNDENFIIIINKNYVTNESILNETIFKLYEPYMFMDYRSNCKIIINVCKFEFVSIEK